jgi:hypothetical protein
LFQLEAAGRWPESCHGQGQPREDDDRERDRGDTDRQNWSGDPLGAFAGLLRDALELAANQAQPRSREPLIDPRSQTVDGADNLRGVKREIAHG